MLSSNEEISKYASQVLENGYCIVNNAIDLNLIDEIAEELSRLEKELNISAGNNLFEGLKTTRIYNLLKYSGIMQQIPIHPNILPIVERVLGNGCLISSLSSIAIGPGESMQPLHSDDQLIPIKKPHAPIICNTMWAITDFTEENGATRLVPNSHNFDRDPHPFEKVDTIAAEMPRGSVLIWVGSLWHAGGSNKTDKRRVGIAMNYCAGFIRQQENQQLGIPLDVIKAFPRTLKELVGLSIYNSLIGHIDKKHPLNALFGEEVEANLIWDYARPLDN